MSKLPSNPGVKLPGNERGRRIWTGRPQKGVKMIIFGRFGGLGKVKMIIFGHFWSKRSFFGCLRVDGLARGQKGHF